MSKRRGQAGSPGIAVGWIVAIALVVGLILWITGFFGSLSDAADSVAPGDLQRVVSACETVHAKLPSDISYCREFRELGDEFVTCSFSKISKEVTGEKPTCTEATQVVIDSAKEFCKTSSEVKESNWDKVKVNGQTCDKIQKVYDASVEPDFNKFRESL